MMTEIVSIDLETLSVAPNAAVLSVGVYCDTFEFEEFLDVDDQIKSGAAIDWDTLSWWLKQPDDARLAQACAPRRANTVSSVLGDLHAKLGFIEGPYIVTSNPASFDLAILRWHWMRFGLPAPWPHHTERCYRTYRAQIAPQALRSYEAAAIDVHPGSKHSALVDAKRQHYVLSAARADGLIVR